MKNYDYVIVGSGPNGLAAAITLAQNGRSVLVLEAKDTIGGGTRTSELTLPGFMHDVCSAVHPLGVASPFFRNLQLGQHGLEWIFPPVALAHPFDDGSAAAIQQDDHVNIQNIGRDDRAYQRIFRPLVKNWQKLLDDLLGPFPIPPKHPFIDLRFAVNALLSVEQFSKFHFKEPMAQALFAGMSGHGMLPLDKIMSASFGLMLGTLAHAVGWPIPKGGSQSISNAMASYFVELGGEIRLNTPIDSIDSLHDARSILFDVTPKQFIKICQEKLPENYLRRLSKFRYGLGVFKIDWALKEPIPWTADGCKLASTVHVGGTLEEISHAESEIWAGRHPEKPLVIVTQPSLFDPMRAPDGQHTAWAYSHVPTGSTFNMTEIIESQIERFAPGFRDVILARSEMNPVQLESYNANYVGGDINGGVQDLLQFFTRPIPQWNQYTTPIKNVFICSSS
ncbi:MAG: NAD(P)/FAD-dependent oxidoreductase, partial [Anaerolineaceae bacterium]|nr:NAD(P)/FAD-dependent oxidoreductase [Anaerolineaceae bacterium]